METESVKIFRCIAYNSNGKKCRTRCPPGTFFCCEAHKPKNLENLKEECCICCDEVEVEDMIQLKCGHVQHKNCYFRWINKLNKPSCPLCKAEFNKRVKPNKKKMKKKKVKNNSKNNSNEIMEIKIDEETVNSGPYNTAYNNLENDSQTPPLPNMTQEIFSEINFYNNNLNNINFNNLINNLNALEID